ncbi:CAP domain-containing protein [Lacipirellula sp.]|uniref:CAP domain-containing protein n=1 Tax=Lacipirellula sp. TaxID=2691419 RepID=UPI003D14594F
MRSRHLAALLLLAVTAPWCISTARADVLWTENAESGVGGITTNVVPANYSLIQSSIVGQGGNSFHLANPGFADNWFASNSAFTIQADSKLFFLSRLGFAASGQVARVEMSTNNGATWPISLYAQTGTSTGSAPVESNFALRTVDLSAYAGQSAKFRFNLDFIGGTAFTQTSAGVGWYVDDIQLADQFQKSLYSIGQPSAEEQLYLEYVNRARADAIVEANRLKNENTPGVQSAYSFFVINPQNIVNQFTASVSNGVIDQFAQPLSFNAALNQASELHSQDMLAKGFQGHVSSNSPPAPFTSGMTLGQRAQAVGYVGSLGENVYSYSSSVAEGHAAFDVDWGSSDNSLDPNYNPAFVGQGMQNPAGHRISIHNNDFKEVGIGLVTGSGPNGVGPQIVTQDFGNAGPGSFITGVVYEDLNNNNFYDVGEGRSGVRVDVPGSAYYALSSLSGGYSIPVTANGVYDVLFSGGGFANYGTSITIAGGLNVKVDYHAVAAPSYAADFNDDGRVDGLDLAKWKGDFGVNAFSDANSDGKTDGADFLVWQRQFGSGVTPAAAVPEPAGGALLASAALALCAGCNARRRS